MAQTLELFVRGLHTNPNPHSEAPQGALSVASNLVIDRESIGESRRGFKQYGDILSDIKKLLAYQSKLLVHDDDTLYFDSDDAGTWMAYAGTFLAPNAAVAIQSAELTKSLYFTSDVGVQRLDSVTGTPQRSGVPRALDGTAVTSGASGFMADATTVAYRVLWGYRDANRQLVLGAPSARIVVANTSGGTRDVDLEFTIPEEITTSYFYQLYRSEQAVSATQTPSEELQLVAERLVTGAEITAGVVTVTDSAADDSKGAFIYTAPSQEGFFQTNDRPPLAVDVTEFRQHLFFVNTKQPHRLLLQFTKNFVAADTIDIDGNTYTAHAVESIPTDEFQVGATITDTMRSLIRVVNRSSTTTTVYLYEVSPTSFLVETRGIPGTQFTVDSSVADIFSVDVPINSDNEARSNRLHVSKLQRGDAAPLTQFFDAGSANKEILRVLSVRDAVFPLKEDGIYRVTGTDLSNFVLEPHDTTIRIVGANTAAALDNRVFMMSNRGVVAVSATGVDDTIGRPIERTLLQLSKLSNFEELAWGVAYDSDRKYILAVPQLDTDTVATRFYVLNYFTRAWTTWELACSTGVVHTLNDQLYLGRVADSQVIEERKAYTLDDYSDDEYAVIIDSFVDDTVTLDSVPAGVVEGTSLKQGASNSVILAIDGVVLTLADADLPWAAGAATVHTPIMVQLQWLKNGVGNPSVLKHFQEATLLFEDARFNEITIGFGSNFLPGQETVNLESNTQGAWGELWDTPEWGGQVGGAQPLRTYVPLEAARAHWLNVSLELNQAFTAFSFVGAGLTFNPVSTRFRSA